MQKTNTSTRQEPVILNEYQDFRDLPPMILRKGIDDEGNPWSPDILLCSGPPTGEDPMRWAHRQFGGRAFGKDFSGEEGVLDGMDEKSRDAFWVIRLENRRSRRKLLTMRLLAAPAGFEDEVQAWTPFDKFLFEIEPKQQAAVARKVDLGSLFHTWRDRGYFRDLHLPADPLRTDGSPVWIFVAALVTDAAVDHPENVCHCGSVQACNATAEGLDRRDPRYPFERSFRRSVRTTFSLLEPAAMRIFRLGGDT